MKYICVYCGSNSGAGDIYLQNAKIIGETIASNNYGIIYGGSSNGTMGEVARSSLNAGGKVIGVMAKDLLDGKRYKERLQSGLTQILLPQTLPERKRIMIEKADAFIALPGGLGTIDEIMEVMNEYSCGLHSKKIALLNTNGYYNHIQNWLIHAQKEGFLHNISLESFIFEENPVTLIEKLIRDL